MSNEIENIVPSTVRGVIEQYVQGRLNDKLENVSPDNLVEREKLLAKYEIETWLESASLRISQLTLATHTPKQHHPSSKASAVFYKPQQAQHEFVGSAGLVLEADVIGNAAVLDVFKLLRLKHQGVSLLDRLLNADAEFIAALAKEKQQAAVRYQRFLAFSEMPEQFNAGRLSKQVYFPVVDDQYHVLTILYPSAFIHGVYKQLSNDRFGEQSKIIREARFNKLYSQLESREYPNLLTQNYGGSKPQNISQLNSDRRGSMWLLPSLPPVWTGQMVALPKSSSVFSAYFSNREEVKPLLRSITAMYRKKDTRNNVEFRTQRDALVQQLVDSAIDLGIELQQSAVAGWTIEKPNFNRDESYWLDRGYRELLFEKEDLGTLDEDEQDWLTAYRKRDWHAEVGINFGQWLSEVLTSRTKLQDLGDEVDRVWSLEFRDQLALLTEEFA